MFPAQRVTSGSFIQVPSSGYVATANHFSLFVSKSDHPVMLPLRITSGGSIFCQSPIIIGLCCCTANHVWIQYFVKVPSCCTANHVWIQYFVKVPSSGYVVALQTMCGFNILSKSHHPVMLLHCKPCVDSIFVKVPSSGYVTLLSEGTESGCVFLFQRPVILLTFLRKDGLAV